MSQSTSNNPNTFPHLLEDNLKQRAKRWIKYYSKVPFERIVLYSYSSAFQRITGRRVPTLYAVVFELSADTKDIPFFIDDKNSPSREEFDLMITKHAVRRIDILEKGYHKGSLGSFLSDIQDLSTVEPLNALLPEDFRNVYKPDSINDNFRDEWTFIPKINNMGVSASVMTEEPHWILFEKDIATPKKLRPNQRHKIECIEMAKKLWAVYPEMTIPEMHENDKIKKACEGKEYTLKTFQRWVTKYNPNKQPGRRPKKS